MCAHYMYEDIDNTDLLLCPITNQVFTDPVIASDGWTYERNALAALLNTDHRISPKTGQSLDRNIIIPNLFTMSFLRKCKVHYL